MTGYLTTHVLDTARGCPAVERENTGNAPFEAEGTRFVGEAPSVRCWIAKVSPDHATVL